MAPRRDPHAEPDPVVLDEAQIQPQTIQQVNEHKVFICLPMGRPGEWRLRHAKFTGNAGQPSNVTDRDMFKSVRAEISRYQASRGLARLLFPLRVGKVEYYEVSGQTGCMLNTSTKYQVSTQVGRFSQRQRADSSISSLSTTTRKRPSAWTTSAQSRASCQASTNLHLPVGETAVQQLSGSLSRQANLRGLK